MDVHGHWASSSSLLLCKLSNFKRGCAAPQPVGGKSPASLATSAESKFYQRELLKTLEGMQRVLPSFGQIVEGRNKLRQDGRQERQGWKASRKLKGEKDVKLKSFPSNKIVSQNTHKKILTYCQKPFSQWRTILSGFKSDAGRRQLLLAGKIERHPAGLWAITARQVVNGGRKDCLPSALSVRTAAPGAARSSFRRHNGLRVREY